VYKLKAEAERNFFFLLQTPPRHNPCTHIRPCHPTLFFSLSLSHISSFTSSSPTLSPPRLFISLTSSSPMGFSPFSSYPSPLHLPWVFPPHLFISHGFFPHLFISQLIAPSISYLNSPLPTTPTIGDAALEFFFLPPVLLWWFVYERCNFFPFCSLIGFVDFVVCVITRFVVFIFIFLLDLWVLNLGL
jgi:hypothetical protein